MLGNRAPMMGGNMPEDFLQPVISRVASRQVEEGIAYFEDSDGK